MKRGSLTISPKTVLDPDQVTNPDSAFEWGWTARGIDRIFRLGKEVVKISLTVVWRIDLSKTVESTLTKSRARARRESSSFRGMGLEVVSSEWGVARRMVDCG